MKVKDVLGNETVGQTIKNMVEYDTDKPVVEEIEVVAADKVVIKFNQFLKRVDSDAFKVMGATPASMDLSEKDGKTVVTLYVKTKVKVKDEDGNEILIEKIKADASNVKVVIDAEDEDVKVLNIFDLEPDYAKFDAEDDEVKDKIAPSIATNESGAYKITASDNKITIEFTEAIEDGDLSNRTFEVKDNKITGITSLDDESDEDSTNTVTITLETPLTADGEVSITQKQPVYDMSGNEYKLDKTVTVKVTAGGGT